MELKSLKNFLRRNKGLNKIPRSAQDIINIDTIYNDGIFKFGDYYSKTYRFADVNFSFVSEIDKKSILLNYGNMLNSFDATTTVKITINNRKMDMEQFKNDILIKEKEAVYDEYIREHNRMLLNRLSECDEIVQEKYITVTTYKKNIQDARMYFSRINVELTSFFQKMGSRIVELNDYERLNILHDIYRYGEDTFQYDYKNFIKKSHSFKDAICPRSPEFKHKYFKLGDKYCRILYLSNYPSIFSEIFLNELCAVNIPMIYSMDLLTIPPDEASKYVEMTMLGILTNLANWQRRQNANNNFSAPPPYETTTQIDECESLLDELTENDQKMMLCTISIMHMADTLEELDIDTERLKSAAMNYELSILYFSKRQLDGLNTVLPIGVNRLNITRTLLTKSASMFVPFRAQEIMDKGGIYYGQNRITNKPIIINQAYLQNQNAFIFGVPGSGKSFLTKLIIELLAMSNDDDILICDPEGEYDEIVKEFQGQIIEISANSKDHINAMDMEIGYGESENPIREKSQFIMSLFKELDDKGITNECQSIIDRCVSIVYKRAMKTNSVVTFKDLRNVLQEQKEKEAQSLAVKLELYSEGSLDLFSKKTNVNTDNRIVSYNISNLSSTLKAMGLLVITDAMINRVNKNWKEGKRTHIFIDEFHVVYEHESSAAFLDSAWRQFRKRNAYPTGITQNVSYLLKSQYGKNMLSNSALIVMLNQAEPDAVELANLLQMREEELNYVMNAPTGYGLIKYGKTLVPFKNEIPEDSKLYQLNNTTPCKRVVIEQKDWK